MTQRSYISIALFSVVISALFLFSCKHKNKTDEDLYLMAKSTKDFVWYKNSCNKLPKSASSGHSQPFLNTRYNAIAASYLNESYQVKAGSTFPNESVIVKELYDNSGKLELYAILYKKTAHANADSNGWVWGYINADGSVRISSTKKGTDCASCHSQSDNIDYMLMNKYFP